eukprot:3487221-Rhodomonas_salina.2
MMMATKRTTRSQTRETTRPRLARKAGSWVGVPATTWVLAFDSRESETTCFPPFEQGGWGQDVPGTHPRARRRRSRGLGPSAGSTIRAQYHAARVLGPYARSTKQSAD